MDQTWGFPGPEPRERAARSVHGAKALAANLSELQSQARPESRSGCQREDRRTTNQCLFYSRQKNIFRVGAEPDSKAITDCFSSISTANSDLWSFPCCFFSVCLPDNEQLLHFLMSHSAGVETRSHPVCSFRSPLGARQSRQGAAHTPSRADCRQQTAAPTLLLCPHPLHLQ